MPCRERKRPSQPSEPAELKTKRRKETALRNACIANLRACLLFSSTNRVSADFGARHNHNAERKVSPPLGYTLFIQQFSLHQTQIKYI